MPALLYRSLLFVHILAALAFMLCHGASASVAFRLRQEENLDRIRALLDLSGYMFTLMYVSLAALILVGIVQGFTGHWWARGWIWVSVILLLGLLVAMSLMPSRHLHRIRKAVGLSFLEGYKPHEPIEPASAEEIRALVQSVRPRLNALIGGGVGAIVLGLMIFKPF